MKANGHPAPAPAATEAVAKPRRQPKAKPAPTNGHAGTWHAHVDHLGHRVPVPGLARTDGYQARVKGAELLSVPVGWVRVKWEPAEEKARARS